MDLHCKYYKNRNEYVYMLSFDSKLVNLIINIDEKYIKIVSLEDETVFIKTDYTVKTLCDDLYIFSKVFKDNFNKFFPVPLLDDVIDEEL